MGHCICLHLVYTCIVVAIEKMDALLSSPTAWESQYKNIADIDTLKVPECGESFITLMSTITGQWPSATKVWRCTCMPYDLKCLIDCLLEMEGFLLSKDHVELTLQFTSISLLNTCINFCIFPDLALNFETTPVVPLVETSSWILSSIWFKAGVCNLFHKFSFQKLNYQYKPLKWSNIHQ